MFEPERRRRLNGRAMALVCAILLTATRLTSAQTAAPATGAGTGAGAEVVEEASAGAGERNDREWLPSKPFSFWNGRIVISGDASLTVGPRDRGYFDTLEYYHDAFSVMRLGLSAAVRLNDRISVLGQVVDDIALRGDPFINIDRHVVRIYALFVRVQPWTTRPFEVQAGRVPPVFGAYGRQVYGSDNPLIGVPLAYQYATDLRSDVVPMTAQSLLDKRGGGWSFRYAQGLGAQYFGPGMPLVESQQWDTGVEAHWGTNSSPIDASIAITNGTLSAPMTDDNNNGKQVAGRVAFRPATGFIAGVSAARGEFLDRDVLSQLPTALRQPTYTQRAVGVDAEYSRGYWLIRGESILSAWRVPAIDTRFDQSLRAWSSFVETKWRVAPRWYLAARADRLGFSRIDSAIANMRQTWDAPVTRVEAGGGYTIRRNVRAKVSYQYNWRDGGRVRREGLLGAQLVYWF